MAQRLPATLQAMLHGGPGAAASAGAAEGARIVPFRRMSHRHQAIVLAATTRGWAPRMDLLTITQDRPEAGGGVDGGPDIIRISGPYADVLAYIADSPDCVVRFESLNGAVATAELTVP